jgi:hypothetical protein
MNASRLLITLGFIASCAASLTPQAIYAQDSRRAPGGTDRIIRQMSDPDLKAFYVRCSQGALQKALSGSDIQLCSVGYEALLTRTFKGDFSALLAWSRAQAAIAPAGGKRIEGM